MKKLLVLLLALTMVFAFAATAMAADTEITDYADLTGVDADLQTAIYRLSALGVLEGSGGWGGDYRPLDNLTRAEFAKIAIYLTGNEDKVELYASQASAFADVAEGFWAEGYINAAYDLGLMKGRTTVAPLVFDPQGLVTFQEVATVVLRALGYDDNLKGEWPNDYSRKAGEVGLIKWVDYVGAKAVNRAEMASIANEALDCYMVSFVENEIAQGLGYVMGGNVDLDGFAPFIYYTNQDDEDGFTYLLNYAFDAYTVDVQFADAENAFSEASGWGYDKFADGELVLLANYDWDEEDIDWDEDGEFAVAANYYIAGGNLVDLGNQLATLTVVDDDDDEVAFVEITSSVVRANEVTASSGKIKADGTKYSFNSELGEAVIAGGDLDSDRKYTGTPAYGELFFDEDGDLYDYKEFEGFENTDFMVFDDMDDTYINFSLGGDRLRISKLDDYKVWKDGAFVDWADLETGDLIYQAPDELEGGVDLYLAYAPQVGSLQRAYSDGVKIDDFKYGDIAGSSYSEDGGSSWTTFDGNETLRDEFFEQDVNYVAAYAFNNFIYFSIDIVDANYGVVTKYVYEVTSSTGDAEIVGLKLYLADDTTVTMDLDDEIADENDAPPIGSLIRFSVDDEELVTDSIRYRYDGSSFETLGGLDLEYTTLGHATDYSDSVSPVTVEVDDEDSEIEFDGETYTLAEDAEVFLVTLDAAYAYDDVDMITAAKVLKNDFEAYRIAAVFTSGQDGLTIKTLYIAGVDGIDNEPDVALGFVTDVLGYSSDDSAVMINGAELKVASRTIYDEIEDAIGAFIVYDLNSDDEISKIEVLVDADGTYATWDDDAALEVLLDNITYTDNDSSSSENAGDELESFSLAGSSTVYTLLTAVFDSYRDNDTLTLWDDGTSIHVIAGTDDNSGVYDIRSRYVKWMADMDDPDADDQLDLDDLVAPVQDDVDPTIYTVNSILLVYSGGDNVGYIGLVDDELVIDLP